MMGLLRIGGWGEGGGESEREWIDDGLPAC